MHPFELLSMASTVTTAIALLLIAMALMKGLVLYRERHQHQLRTYTHAIMKADLRWRERILFVLQKLKGREISHDDLREDSEFTHELRTVLNYCEFTSLGIRHGIYDEETVRDFYATLFVVLYVHVERMIHESRYESNNPETYGAFTAIVKKWQHHSPGERMP